MGFHETWPTWQREWNSCIWTQGAREGIVGDNVRQMEGSQIGKGLNICLYFISIIFVFSL